MSHGEQIILTRNLTKSGQRIEPNINYGLGLLLELLICEEETRTHTSASVRGAI
jgi:hypothetical protein